MATQAFVIQKPARGGIQSRRRCQPRLTCARAADDQFASYVPSVAFLFPGQGAQTVGMAKELCDECAPAKELFDKASEILGYDLLAVCAEGPKDKLDSTVVSQPAIYVSSMAALEKLKQDRPEVVESANAAAGLSLGEYTALAFAGAMTFEDGLALVKLRGESMQAAADAADSSMVSVIGLDSGKVQEVCDAVNERVGAGSVQIANFLCPGNYVISGSSEGCKVVAEIAKPEFKARMTVPLAVAGAFHTDYMAPAVDKLKEALANTPITTPRIPVVSNVDAQPHSDPDTIKDILARQVTSPVQWETSLKTMLDKGLAQSYEIGPNKVIAGIMKRIDRKHSVENITA
eukprot:jgi/Ulvmu1/7867/UM004_0098.1